MLMLKMAVAAACCCIMLPLQEEAESGLPGLPEALTAAAKCCVDHDLLLLLLPLQEEAESGMRGLPEALPPPGTSILLPLLLLSPAAAAAAACRRRRLSQACLAFLRACPHQAPAARRGCPSWSV
jgi:hypothetical protein